MKTFEEFESDTEEVGPVLVYTYVFQVGTNVHRCEVYEGWSRRDGAQNKLDEFEDTRADRLEKAVKRSGHATRDQLEELDVVTTRKVPGIVIGPEGETLESSR